MPAPILVQASHRYTASAERVFDAWLNPQQAGRFLFKTRTGNILRCELDPKVGGHFVVTDRRPTAEGDESVMDAEHRGTFTQIDRPNRLVFSFSVPPYMDEPTHVAVDIIATGPTSCELMLTHDLGASYVNPEIQDRTRRGWVAMLATLEKELFPKRIAL